MPPLYSANGMFRQSRLCSPLEFLGLAACTEDPRPKSATGRNSTMAGALRCGPYEEETLAVVAGARVVDAAAVSAMMNSTRPLVLPVLLHVAGGDRLRSTP